MTVRAVLWDLDGTLVDSGDYHWRAFRDVMAAEGRPITHDEFLAIFGQKNDRILRQWMGAGISHEDIVRIGDAKEAEYRRLAREGGLVPLPGAHEWVERLRADAWRQAIATSAPLANVEVMLGLLGLEGRFDAVVSAEDVTAGKPDPQVFLKAAERLGAAADRCIVVEDAAAGVEAARRGRMRSIGVSRTAVLDADVFVRSLADLSPDAFDRLVKR